jgi:hypothetical protein
MSKDVQNILDLVIPALGVVLPGDSLREPGVLAFFATLKYQDFCASKDSASVIEEMKSCSSYTVWCSIADDQLPFGPTLTVKGEAGTGQITVPWQHITAILQLHEPINIQRLGFTEQPR